MADAEVVVQPTSLEAGEMDMTEFGLGWMISQSESDAAIEDTILLPAPLVPVETLLRLSLLSSFLVESFLFR